MNVSKISGVCMRASRMHMATTRMAAQLIGAEAIRGMPQRHALRKKREQNPSPLMATLIRTLGSL